MPTLTSGVSGRGEAGFIDSSGAGPPFIGVYITEFDPVLIDTSLRYNPQWYTFGHASLCLEETVLSQFWVNFVFGVYGRDLLPAHGQLTELGFADYFNSDLNIFQVPYVIKWQFRPSVVATIAYLT